MTTPRRFALSMTAAGLLLLGSVAAPAQEAPAGWTQAAAAKITEAADVDHTAWTSDRAPGGPFDRIEVHRYRVKSAPANAVLLYLPGTNMNGEVAVADEDHNFWIFLARRGVEVFALDYRTRFASSSTDAAALASMKGWSSEVFVDDIKAASALARAVSGKSRLFVAGFSRGVFLAYAYTCVEPTAVQGLIALDGLFKAHAPRNEYAPAADLAKLDASGGWATDVSGRLGWEGRQKLMNAVAANPEGPATDPKFKTLGEQLANLLQFAWGPGALANPLGGQSKPAVLAKLLAGYDRYYPAVQDLDGKRSADRDDDPATAIDDAWGEMKTPILYFGNPKMSGDWLLNGVYSAQKSGSPDVTLRVLNGYGHLDVLVGEQARREVFEPALAWIRDRAGRP